MWPRSQQAPGACGATRGVAPSRLVPTFHIEPSLSTPTTGLARTLADRLGALLYADPPAGGRIALGGELVRSAGTR